MPVQENDLADVRRDLLKGGWVRKTTTYPSGTRKITETKSVPFGFDKIRRVETQKGGKKR